MTVRLGPAAALAGTLALGGGAAAGVTRSLDWQAMTPNDGSALTYAIAVGQENDRPLYACRARVGAGTQPGRFRTDFTGCHIGYGGEEISVNPFEVLTTGWQDDASGGIPPASFVAGQRAEIGAGQRAEIGVAQRAEIGPGQRAEAGAANPFALTPLFPCRATFQNSTQVGEIAAGDRGCRFGFGARQVTELKYQVLADTPWLTWIPGIIRQIPPDAVTAGMEGGEPFYICRASSPSGLHTGKIKQSSPGCGIASEGREIVARQFSVLVPKWVAGNAGTIPVAALPVGNERDGLIYLCRAQVKDTLQIGKMTDEFAACHVGMLGRETAASSYDILSAR